jgi:NAD(P)-dependent dehydrogenase (short-subunit alcohol dehydrogenase family)
MDLMLEGLTVLVTGGSRGIGRATALAFAREGANVVFCGRNSASLNAVEQEIRQDGGECCQVTADLASDDGCRSVIEAAVERYGHLDVLVNNVTAEVMASPMGSTDDEVLGRIRAKSAPAIRCARLAVPHMKAVGGGSIIMVGGIGARIPLNRFGPPSGLDRDQSTVAQGIGNAVLANYTKYLSDEVGPFGINVNIVHPGVVLTDRVRERFAKLSARTAVPIESITKEIAEGLPMQRLVTEQEVAMLINFLASPRCRGITGQSVGVDGGMARVILY